MYYLSNIIGVFLKVTIAMFYFAIQKILQILRKIFLIPSVYVLEKNFLVNKYKKQMCYQGNKSLFF